LLEWSLAEREVLTRQLRTTAETLASQADAIDFAAGARSWDDVRTALARILARLESTPTAPPLVEKLNEAYHKVSMQSVLLKAYES